MTRPGTGALVLVASLASTGLALGIAGLMGCAPSAPACSPPSALALIEANYVAEMVASCRGFSFDACPTREAVEAKYGAMREGWAKCSK